ncbi:MAG: hypothetical protein NT070_22740 [Cyanobacteria bacterium]|nr:hypothetical protein [Cyanobacteriota bacterium]
MNLILHEAPRLLANILILQPIDERYIWMPTTAILGEPKNSTIVSNEPSSFKAPALRPS